MIKLVSKASGTIISMASLVVFSIFFITKLYNFGVVVSELNIVKSIAVVGTLIVLFGFIFYVYIGNKRFVNVKNKINSFNPNVIALIIVFSSALVSVFCFFYFKSDFYGSADRYAYYKIIEELVTKGIVQDEAVYARKYTYTLLLSLFYYPISKLIGTSCLSFFITNILVFSVRNYLIFSIVKNYAHNLTAFLITCFVAFNFEEMCYMRLPTHEHFFTTFALLAFWLVTVIYPKLKSKKFKYLFLILLSVVLRLTYRANSAGRVLVIAFMIFFIVKFFIKEDKIQYLKKSWSYILCFVLAFAICFNVSDEIKSFYVDALTETTSSYTTQKKKSYKQLWRYIYIGSDYESQGNYSNNDIQNFNNKITGDTYIERSECAKKLALAELCSTYSSFQKGMSHLCHKMNWLVGYYSYGIWNYSDKTSHSDFFDIIKQIYNFLSYFAFCLIYLVIIFSYKRRNFNNFEALDIIKMFIVGFTAVMMVVECNTKYGTNMNYFVFVLFGCMLPRFCENVKIIVRKKQ